MTIAKRVAEARAEYEQQKACWQLAHAFLDTVKVRRAEGNRLKPEAVEVMQARDHEQSEFISMTSKVWTVYELTRSPEYIVEVNRLVDALADACFDRAAMATVAGPDGVEKLAQAENTARAALLEFVTGVKQ